MQLDKHKYIRQKKARDTVQRWGLLQLEEGFWLEGNAGRRLLRSRKSELIGCLASNDIACQILSIPIL